MADKKDDTKKDEKKKPYHSSGGMSFGMEVIIFIIVLFVLWALMKRPSENVDKPFIQPETPSVVTQ